MAHGAHATAAGRSRGVLALTLLLTGGFMVVELIGGLITGSLALYAHYFAVFPLIAQGGWTAVFGFYSPATRSTDMIPLQVRLLRSLIVGWEAGVARIILASGTDGTYVPRATPKATPR